MRREMIVVNFLALIELLFTLGILLFLYNVYKILTRNANIMRDGCIVVIILIVIAPLIDL